MPILIVVDSNQTFSLDPERTRKILWHVMNLELKNRAMEQQTQQQQQQNMEDVLFSLDQGLKVTNDMDIQADMYKPSAAKPNSPLLELLFNGTPFSNNSSVVGVLILCCIVCAVFLLLCSGFLMYRFCNRTLDGVRRKMTLDFTKAFPDVVAHPKRVYEIQAEEGVYSANDMPTADEQPREGSLKRDDSRSSKSSGLTAGRPRQGPNSDEAPTSPLECPAVDDDADRNPPAPPPDFRKKERKIHKDSVCAMVFRSNQKRPLPELV